MKHFKKIIILFLFIFTANCGYTPILNYEKFSFYIDEINFEGDRKINNYIDKNLKKYQTNKDAKNKYSLNLNSTFLKTILNKDKDGKPKNYNLEVKISVKIISDNDKIENKTLTRSILLETQDKKITEKELENKYKKDLSNLLAKDIIFLLSNK